MNFAARYERGTAAGRDGTPCRPGRAQQGGGWNVRSICFAAHLASLARGRHGVPSLPRFAQKTAI